MRFTFPRRAVSLACAIGLSAGVFTPAAAGAEEAAPAPAAGIEALTNPSVLTVTRDPETKNLDIALDNKNDSGVQCRYYVYEKSLILKMLGETMADPAALADGAWSPELAAELAKANADGKAIDGRTLYADANAEGAAKFPPQPSNKEFKPAAIAGCQTDDSKIQFIELAPDGDVNPILDLVAGSSGGAGAGSIEMGSAGSLTDKLKSLITPEFIFGDGGSLGALSAGSE